MLIVNPNPSISFLIGFSPVKRVCAGTFAGTFFSQIGAVWLSRRSGGASKSWLIIIRCMVDYPPINDSSLSHLLQRFDFQVARHGCPFAAAPSGGPRNSTSN